MILCCGEALIDMIPDTLPSGRTGFAPVSGGAIFNSSIALGRLGIDAGLLTALSRDMFGEQLLADLKASNVQTGQILYSDQPSTLAFVKLENGQARYAFFDELSAESQLRAEDAPELPENVSALYFGGISLARDPGGDFYANIARRNTGTIPMMIDPNVRPGFIRNETAYRARLDAMLGASDIIKVSDEDLEWLLPDLPSSAARIAEFRDRYKKIIIMTRGAEGATAWLPNGEELSAPARKAEVVDTVAAGDTFNAGVLASLKNQGVLSKDGLRTIEPEKLRQALAYGAAVAGITVSRIGADPPWAHEIN